MNTSLIVIEVNYGAIDADYSTCHGCYIIIFSLYPYTLQSDLIIDGQVIYYAEILCEGTYYFPINIKSHYCVSPNNKSNNTIVSLRTIINGSVNVIFYYSNDVVSPSLM